MLSSAPAVVVVLSFDPEQAANENTRTAASRSARIFFMLFSSVSLSAKIIYKPPFGNLSELNLAVVHTVNNCKRLNADARVEDTL